MTVMLLVELNQLYCSLQVVDLLIIFSLYSNFECIFPSVLTKGRQHIINQTLWLLSVYTNSCAHEGNLDSTLAWTSLSAWVYSAKRAVDCEGSGNQGLLFRTAAQTRMDEIFQPITYRCSLRECLGSFTQFNLRHK